MIRPTVAVLAIIAATASSPTTAMPRLGGPGLAGGFSHMGAATSIHAPGGGASHSRLGGGGAGERDMGGGATMRPGQGGAGERWPGPPGPNPPGPGPGPGPRPPGPPPPPPPGPYWWGWDNDPFWDYPVATAAAVGVAVGATAAVTSAALGSTVYVLPAQCATVTGGDGLTYFNCAGVWYQPRYLGSGVTYVVVGPPV